MKKLLLLLLILMSCGVLNSQTVISSYDNKEYVLDDDKLLGTDATTNRTKNFLIKDIAAKILEVDLNLRISDTTLVVYDLTDVVDSINALPLFQVGADELKVFDVTLLDGGDNPIGRELSFLKIGKGYYGLGGIPITNSDLLRFGVDGGAGGGGVIDESKVLLNSDYPNIGTTTSDRQSDINAALDVFIGASGGGGYVDLVNDQYIEGNKQFASPVRYANVSELSPSGLTLFVDNSNAFSDAGIDFRDSVLDNSLRLSYRDNEDQLFISPFTKPFGFLMHTGNTTAGPGISLTETDGDVVISNSFATGEFLRKSGISSDTSYIDTYFNNDVIIRRSDAGKPLLSFVDDGTLGQMYFDDFTLGFINLNQIGISNMYDENNLLPGAGMNISYGTENGRPVTYLNSSASGGTEIGVDLTTNYFNSGVGVGDTQLDYNVAVDTGFVSKHPQIILQPQRVYSSLALERSDGLATELLIQTGNVDNDGRVRFVGSSTSTSIAHDNSDGRLYKDTPSNIIATAENTVAYTPTGDYNAATKKYVDDAFAGGVLGFYFTGEINVFGGLEVNFVTNMSGTFSATKLSTGRFALVNDNGWNGPMTQVTPNMVATTGPAILGVSHQISTDTIKVYIDDPSGTPIDQNFFITVRSKNAP